MASLAARGVSGYGVEIDVDDVAAHGMVLHFLNERETVGGLAAVVDFEFDENVFADSVSEETLNVLLGNFEVLGSILGAVNDGRHGAASAHLLDGIAPGFRTGAG